MDILDIDEALKDDSYIFLADRAHDDISNILQQWKTNNQLQTQTPMVQQQQQYSNEQDAYKHNSKTFTRPKRRSLLPQNLGTQFQGDGNGPPMLKLEIGGLVTNMHKSFLQDTSPPSSICSSIANERMNNSLITSADFTNLNFLQSTESLELDFNLTNTTQTLEGYTLSDMIRDRKVLESLTMSTDGTLIKDSHIGQIDDISLTLSKTASGYSTMDNSTESMSNPVTVPAFTGALQRTMLLGEDMISDTTFNLVDSINTPSVEVPPQISDAVATATFKKPTVPILDETLLLNARQVNTTFTDGLQTPEARCETPENVVEQKLGLLQFESTPLTTNVRPSTYSTTNNNNINNHNNNNNKPQYMLKGQDDDVNLSPIVSTTPMRSSRLWNNTYEAPQTAACNLSCNSNSNGNSNNSSTTIGTVAASASAPAPQPPSFDGNKFVMDTMELLEQIEQPLDNTYNMTEHSEQEQVALLAQHKQMQCVMDLAEAEVELLAQQGDEEQFEHMLAELGKVNLNTEQLKMEKSLKSIKQRFNSHQSNNQSMTVDADNPLNITHDAKTTTTTAITTNSVNSTSSFLQSSSHNSSSGGHNNSSSGGPNSSSERLLSRRSRLYDDVNLSAVQSTSNGSCNSTSFIVQREVDDRRDDEACLPLDGEDSTATSTTTAETEATANNYKLAERRARDRDRFKTIRISKEMRDEQQDLQVPCIDDEEQQQPLPVELEPQERLSRRERTAVMNNYLTYKKPKEKGLPVPRQQQHQLPQVESNEPMAPAPRAEIRSLSRPRFISGLQKFTTVSKATSAGAGLNATHSASSGTTTINATDKTNDELKSPMGIKSKSFHNLSSNVNGGASRAGAFGLRRPGGLRGPSSQHHHNHQQQQQNSETTVTETNVFKVPKTGGLRTGTGNVGAKRGTSNGLARPSTGYFSLNGKAEAETPESLSSASSRGSLYGQSREGPKQNGNMGQFDTQALSSKLTQVTTGATGIPKPSGLRPPTQMKRSALPRPSSIVRR